MNLKLRKYNSNISFLDTFLLTLIGITAILAIVVKLINPISEDGKIDPVTELMLMLEWNPNLPPDLDIHVKTPNGDVISFRNRDNGWMVIDRDDLGHSSDQYMINGKTLNVKKNMEVINVNAIVPGEYVVNVHYYSPGNDYFWKDYEQLLSMKELMSYKVTLMDMHPFSVLYTAENTDLRLRTEQTVMTFVVTEQGNVVDIRTDIQISLFGSKKRTDDLQ
tara:strand:+ start:421 stop:1080 length:660 start_codon:yes stop_codon:yes gene_type:complete